jgi:hypothetical protein
MFSLNSSLYNFFRLLGLINNKLERLPLKNDLGQIYSHCDPYELLHLELFKLA